MTNPKTTVISTPGCVQCTATYRKLDELAAEYEVLDATDPAVAPLIETIRAHHNGATQAPFVIVNGNLEKSWVGYNPAMILTHSIPTEMVEKAA